MGICGSKSSARSTCGSEKSEKCRWDKHGNVFFPVKRRIQQQQQQQQQAASKNEVFSSTTNPVFEELDASVHSKGSSHFANFTRFLKVARTSASSSSQDLHENSSVCTTSKSRIPGYKDLLVAAGLRKDDGTTAVKPCKFKFVDAKTTVNLSRSSSSKEGSTLARTSSAKEPALSRCSSQKDGKVPPPAEVELQPLKLLEESNAEPAPENSADDPRSVLAELKSASKAENIVSVTSSPVVRGLGLPLVFTAGSPEKCRGRSSSLSGDELAAVPPRRRRSPNRRSPNKVSPSRRSPRQRSPSKKPACPSTKPPAGNGLTLNSSAARFQRSLPRSENLPPEFFNSFRPPRSSTGKKDPLERSVLTELTNDKRGSLPPKPLGLNGSRKLADHLRREEHGATMGAADARSGSKRLRSPQKAGTTVSKEYVNVRLTLPESRRSGSCPSEDKHINSDPKEAVQGPTVAGDGDSKSGSLAERDLLELLERTPKKLKKMALKLALMIELEHSRDDEDEPEEPKSERADSSSSSAENAQTDAYVKRNRPQEDQGVDLDLELKLGRGNDKRGGARRGDNVRVGLSFNLDSPSRAGSVSLPMTPRHAVSPICNGLSVEARIGSSRGECSDISFRILKNPDKLFGDIDRPRTERTAPEPESDLGPEAKFRADKAMLGSRGIVRDGQGAETKTCVNAAHHVERCSSFDFKNDKPYSVVAESDKDLFALGTVRDGSDGSPAFEFKLKSSMKSDPATPVMPSVERQPKETDALSLSADEIAEIWGAFEAGQATPTKCES